MDAPSGEDWKNNVGFPINYHSASSDDDFDANDVVFRNPRYSSKYLLQDSGDGAEADLLGSTPPRSRIRDKEKGRRMQLDTPNLQRLSQKREAADYSSYEFLPASDRLKKRSSLKLIRNRARDSKQDMSHEPRADSLPSPNPMAAVPTLVESCNRFMSLTSRPKHREERQDTTDPEETRWRCDDDEELPPSRVSFHKTFSLLINMGNIEKGCKRAISREEQVWQNELKDLIWLELQAKLAGRTLAQQDAYLCTQRNIVPKIIDDILHYKFVNTTPCKNLLKQCSNLESSTEDLTAQNVKDANISEEDIMYGCLSFECASCAGAVGRALREVGVLLDSFYSAVSLYPSSRNMTLEHPQIATPHFDNRMKAMCLWYNTALHIRLIMVTMRRMLRSIRRRTRHSAHSINSSASSDRLQEARPCQVRFNVSSSDLSNSDGSAQSDTKDSTHSDSKEDERDDVDSASVSTAGHCPPTPELRLPASSGDPHASAESGYVSGEGAYSLGSLAELTQMRLLNKCQVSFYRDYHREILKTMGVRRCMMFIDKMREDLLDKVCLTLEKPDNADLESITEEEESGHVFEDSEDTVRPTVERNEDEIKSYELRRYGCWSEEYLQMRLPSYRSHFLLLSGICMEAVHDYLSFRLESRPDHPSCLTVKQLIHELREGLDISSEMRAQWTRHVAAGAARAGCGARAGRGVGGARAGRDDGGQLELLTDTFDETVQTVFKQYLSYLTTMSETEHLSRGRLQEEWAFTGKLARRISCAALLAPTAFSNITCNQLNRLLNKFEIDFTIKEGNKPKTNKPEADKYTMYVVLRAAQSWYASSRDATLQCAQWARALAARLARAPAHRHVHQRAQIFNCLMSIRDVIVRHILYIMERSRVALSNEMLKDQDTILVRVRELLLMIYKLGFELHRELYRFVHANKWLEDVYKRRSRPISLQPARSPMVERRKRPETMIVHESFNTMQKTEQHERRKRKRKWEEETTLIHRELHRFGNEPAARRAAAGPPRRLARSESVVEEYENSVFDERLYDNTQAFGDNQTQSSIELGPTEQNPSDEEVELRNAAQRSVSCEEKQWAARVARGVIEFARCWMQFVVERCDRGRGLRPRWASQGLEFLMLACDPRNTKHLSDEEFEELKHLMDGCISHVVGTRSAPPAPSPRPRHRLPSPFPNNAGREAVTPPTPPPDTDPLSYPETVVGGTALKRRVLEAISRVDNDRDERLRSCKSVGRVLEAAVSSYEPKLRQLTFKWQRGLKIGAGTFGKVYTVVNTESGQLLAMKELSVGVGDRRALQKAANELRVLEGVVHPHLVRYYGCELHREEMLIFMELCVEGSLEALVATAGALAEPAARRYTKQLLSAVHELHARSIAHRDIKSGNIFLTNEGHCLKLGDFGCAVKIRAHTTAPGELQGYVGTQAYMAPEVFMKTSGHGRAADVWSLGCVVTEMASGKRPFYQYDSNYQIMFLVGSGGRPEIPDTLSEEGQDFCMSCLTHDPDLRPKAEALTLHHFLMVKSDDDCKCEPAFLITSSNVDK